MLRLFHTRSQAFATRSNMYICKYCESQTEQGINSVFTSLLLEVRSISEGGQRVTQNRVWQGGCRRRQRTNRGKRA